MLASMKRKLKTAIAATCALVPVLAIGQGAEQPSESPPSISAVHVRHHEPSDVELLLADIEYSPAGLRVRQRARDSAFEMIQNFDSGRAWLVDAERRIAHELPIEDDTQVNPDRPEPAASFLGSVPCSPAVAREDGSGTFRARDVLAFTCLNDEGEGIAVEFVDREFGIVIYRRSTDGRIDELRDMRARRYDEAHFEPSARFRPVDKRELFHGIAEIAPYVASKEREPVGAVPAR